MFAQAVKAKRLAPLLTNPPLELNEQELDALDYSPVDWLVSELHLANAFLIHIEQITCPVEIIMTLLKLAPDPATDLDGLELERDDS